MIQAGAVRLSAHGGHAKTSAMATRGAIRPTVAFEPLAGFVVIMENRVRQVDGHGGYLLGHRYRALCPLCQVYNWVFPPTGLRFIWDGGDIFWTCDDLTEWQPLSPSAQLPGFSDAFNAAAPE